MSGDIDFNQKEKKKRRIAVIGLSSLMMVAMVAAVTVGIKGTSHKSILDLTTSTKAIRSVCHNVEYQHICERTLAHVHTSDPQKLLRTTFNATIKNLQGVITNSTTMNVDKGDRRISGAFETCKQVMENAIEDLRRSNDQLNHFNEHMKDEYIENIRIWLSGAITLQETCIDAFENTTGDAGQKMQVLLNTSRELTSNSLDFATELTNISKNLNTSDSDHQSNSYHATSNSDHNKDKDSDHASSDSAEDSGDSDKKSDSTHDNSESDNESYSGGHKRKLLAEVKDELPHWVDIRQRRLLHETGANVKADAVVAKDGSGKFESITLALKEAPVTDVDKVDSGVNKTFVIYIKAGVYEEEVRVDTTMSHVMFIGDGPTKTKITGMKNFVDGFVLYQTATVSILGNHFIAKDIGFENSAGIEKHQATALLVQSDKSIFYNCHITSFKNTLFAHSYRQFYRKCTISGTVDFIIGNAAAIFQNCKLVIRKPLEDQDCVLTSQGRIHKKEPTAFILQNCTIADDPLYYPVREKNRAFLGHPWKKFSRTIVMQSFLPDSIAPEGWKPWMGKFGQKTCFFGEFENRGPGSSVTGRVKWTGIKNMTSEEAQGFTPGKFYEGDLWISPSGVPYVSGMMPAIR